MSRPFKEGFDFFRFNTDLFDSEEIKLLGAEFGAKGIYIAIYILNKIYRTNGYYLDINGKKLLLLKDELSHDCSLKLLKEVITSSLQHGLFDKTMYDNYGILTSIEIQRNYIFMSKRRDIVMVTLDYCLLDISSPLDVPENMIEKIKFSDRNKKIINLASSKQAEQDMDAYIFEFPIFNGASYNISSKDIEMLTIEFRGVDIRTEIKNALHWYIENKPENTSRKYIQNLIHKWLKDKCPAE